MFTYVLLPSFDWLLLLQRENAEMCQKIHEERMICLSVKLQIRLLQQKQLESSQSSLLGDL